MRWPHQPEHPNAVGNRNAGFVMTLVSIGSPEPLDYERLATLKAVYDPQNRFCLNVNIPPRQL